MNKETYDFKFLLKQSIFMKLSTQMIFFASISIRTKGMKSDKRNEILECYFSFGYCEKCFEKFRWDILQQNLKFVLWTKKIDKELDVNYI